jgi:hypothetical protein
MAIRSVSISASPQQRVRLGRAGVRLEVVAAREQDRIHLGGRHELHHVDLVAAGHRQLVQILVGEDHQLAVAGLVALGDVGVVDLLAAHAAGALVPDPAAVLAVYLVEPDIVLLGCREQPDRHVDQPEGHGTLPDRPHCDESSLPRSARSGTMKRMRPMLASAGTHRREF